MKKILSIVLFVIVFNVKAMAINPVLPTVSNKIKLDIFNQQDTTYKATAEIKEPEYPAYLFKFKESVVLKITNYTHIECHSTMAKFGKVFKGSIAISRDLYKKGWTEGKKVWIEGLGVFVINDWLAARKTNQIDIYTDNRKEAFEFGVQSLEVRLIED